MLSEIGNGVVVSSGRTALRAAGADADVCAGSCALRAAVVGAAGAVAMVGAGSRALADVAVRLVSLIVSSFFENLGRWFCSNSALMSASSWRISRANADCCNEFKAVIFMR